MMTVDHMINDCAGTPMQGYELCYGASFTVWGSLEGECSPEEYHLVSW